MRYPVLIVSVILVLAGLSAAPAYAIDCGMASPKVTVSKYRSAVEYVRDFTSAGLTQMHTGSYRPGSPNVLGLGGGAVELGATVTFKVKQQGDVACVRVERIDGAFRVHPTMMIAKNYQEGSCEYNAVLAHEKKHVTALDFFHGEYSSKFDLHLRGIAKDYRNGRVTTPGHAESIQRQIQENIAAQVQAYLAKISPVIQKRQLKVDSPEEYARVAKLCKNW